MTARCICNTTVNATAPATVREKCALIMNSTTATAYFCKKIILFFKLETVVKIRYLSHENDGQFPPQVSIADDLRHFPERNERISVKTWQEMLRFTTCRTEPIQTISMT
ncbi:hypothetical protein H8L32_05020 [Undibacterium sp. CY18W]|uniref:Uncharacterized protein n=1 Tax=Undibacterium hunanense TaxID=2762292 RepID=A0ABR6ZML1_9BURK|nr:hypothetical protein [Undibacterium hunanense]MBC3916829.1 hypothetical protein [Undibacterium hunanense]